MIHVMWGQQYSEILMKTKGGIVWGHKIWPDLQWVVTMAEGSSYDPKKYDPLSYGDNNFLND